MEKQDPTPTIVPVQDSSSNPAEIRSKFPKKSKLFYFLVGLIILFVLTVGAVSAVYISKSLKPKPNPAPVTKAPTFKVISPSPTSTQKLSPTGVVKTTSTPGVLPTSTPKPAVTNTAAPTATPAPANSGPPQVNISYPTEGQSISMDSSQQFCAVDSPVSNTVGLERKYNTSGAGWSSYSGVSSPFCYAPAEGSNTLEFQYRNSNGYESSVYTIHFTFHRT